MAKQSPMAGLVHLTIFLALLTVEGTNVVVLRNNMNAEVGITCQLEGTLPGDSQIVFPGNRYELEIIDSSSNITGGRRRYSCVFAAMDKPRTIVEVFVGTGLASHGPCNCPGEVCAWSITANGFSCSGFSHGWGN